MYKDNNFICLWNPSTRKRNIIPSKSFHGKPSRSVYGFCSNAYVKDYEVVEISLFLKRESEVTFYSLRRNSWQRIQVFPYAIRTGRGGVIINGALHWKAHRSRKNGLLQSFESVIIAYDAGGESFREVPYPDHLIRSPCGLRVAT
ncbi:hypothetical protein IFM89_021319 [Coptis chinensis]|uniref:F-box associated beta-propeller type 1 domain-containing protein n=1 Tax=Coptis chinensis TaxID=261450 RepID=A0A835LS06_9MAGN|nr:hypothetical protein IFM89_021319 [Coptis chinensis]